MPVKPGIIVSGLLIAAIAVAAAAAPQGKKEREDPNTRSVQGVVQDASGSVVNGAIVQLKNTKSLMVWSFVTQKEGGYYFHGLSKDVEYELKADFQGSASSVKKLSVFDSRKKAIINLRLEPAK